MNGVDYSQMRSIADELHWNDFVQANGGELIAPLIKRQGVQNADYLFRRAKVVAELKVLETEFAHSKEMLAKVDALVAKYPGMNPDDTSQPLRRELLLALRKPLQRIINKSNRQIKETKAELGLEDHSGVLICVNDNFRGAAPGLIVGLIGHVLAGTSYKSTTAVIYQTNHYVELIEVPYAALLWSPMYSAQAGSDLVEFINDLGRKWRTYAESVDGPFDFAEERPHVQLGEAAVVTGVRRSRHFEG
jgi:hypothetical protein